MFDNHHDHQGLFTFSYKWLIMVDDVQQIWSLEPHVWNITHVTALSAVTYATSTKLANAKVSMIYTAKCPCAKVSTVICIQNTF